MSEVENCCKELWQISAYPIYALIGRRYEL